MENKFKIWFTSDYHLGHKNVIKYDNRPFDNIKEMDNTIIRNHNSVVNEDDLVFFLGDFSFNNKLTREYLKSLKGRFQFIKGNHDKRDTINLYKEFGNYLGEQSKIKVNQQEIVLNHFSMRIWDKSHHGSWHLYGHSHGGLEENPWGKSMDVGIMLNDYYPFEFSDIKKIMDNRDKKIIDHHIE